MRHGWRAWWLELMRDAVAITLFIVALLTMPLGAVLIGGLFGMWYALRACWHVLLEWGRLLRGGKPYDRLGEMFFRTEVAAGGLLGAILVIGGVILAMLLRPQGLRLHGDLGYAGFLAAGLILLFVITSLIRQWQLARLHHPSAVEGRSHSWRLRNIDWQQNHPVTVYSGYHPFVGSGPVVKHWGFAQRLVRKKEFGRERDEEFPPSEPPFTTSEIIHNLKKSIRSLAAISHAETRLPGLTVRDHIFIAGTYVNEVPKDLLRPSPLSMISLKNIMENPSEEVRHHIECQVKAWDGEVVTTVFVHISLQGRTLYVAFSTCVLTPTPSKFRLIDEVGGTGFRATLREIAHDLSKLPQVVVQAPRRLMAAPKQLMNACWAQWPQTVKDKEKRDLGAKISGREIASKRIESDSDDNLAQIQSRRNHEEATYYQELDVYRHMKIIERRLFAAIEEFLRNKGVDTSEFAERANAIQNNGVLNIGPGGTVNFGGHNVSGYQPGVSGYQPSGAGGAAPAA
jgi:hypothetical protein